MKLGIMQPYFCPYIGYFSLIKHTDEFILFDVVQFIRHGWIERNRILKQSGGTVYIQVPLMKHSRETLIKDLQIRNTENWKSKIRAQLTFYKKGNRYYSNVIEVIESVFKNEYNSIVKLNRDMLVAICEFLSIDTKIKIYSEMNLKIDKVNAPDEWALNICKSYAAYEYWNPPNGKSFFDKSKFSDAGIELKFHDVKISKYQQIGHIFEPRLSIIDVMMHNDPCTINNFLDSYNLE